MSLKLHVMFPCKRNCVASVTDDARDVSSLQSYTLLRLRVMRLILNIIFGGVIIVLAY